MRKPTISTDAAFGFATNRRILHGAVLVCALLALALPASAKTVKVDNAPGCSDFTGDPYCTIQAAIDAASPGDKIKVDDGVIRRLLSCWLVPLAAYARNQFPSPPSVRFGHGGDGTFLQEQRGCLGRTVSVWPHVARPRLVN